MAANDTSTNPDLVETDDSVTMSIRRRALVVDAAGEIEQLCMMLKGVLRDDADNMGVSGVVSRIKFLSSRVMGAICDPMESTDYIAENLAA